MNSECKHLVECQYCKKTQLESLVFLGFLPPVNEMYDQGRPPSTQNMYPLELVRCRGCGLTQLGAEVAQEIVFPESYPYLSGVTTALHRNFEAQAEKANKLVN